MAYQSLFIRLNSFRLEMLQVSVCCLLYLLLSPLKATCWSLCYSCWNTWKLYLVLGIKPSLNRMQNWVWEASKFNTWMDPLLCSLFIMKWSNQMKSLGLGDIHIIKAQHFWYFKDEGKVWKEGILEIPNVLCRDTDLYPNNALVILDIRFEPLVKNFWRVYKLQEQAARGSS